MKDAFDEVEADDRRALAAMARGDRAAFEAVYSRLKDDLLRLLVALVGDLSASEDILHDVFVTLAGKAREIRLSGTLRAYLASCCLHRARDVARRERRREAGVSDDFDDLAASSPDPSRRLVAGDESARLAAALDRLSAEKREVVWLHLEAGLTFREIASMIGLSINTAQSRYRHAIAGLKRILAPSNGPPLE